MSTTHNWAARIPIADSPALWSLRLFPNLELGTTVTHAWIRGATLDDRLDHALRLIPGLDRFEVLGFGKLRALSKRIPEGFLPGMQWQPIAKALAVLLPTSALPPVGRASSRASSSLLVGRASSRAESTIAPPRDDPRPITFAKGGLSLVRTSRELPASILKATLQTWADFATSAPESRLQRLTFAASGNGSVLIRGTPLPPLLGEVFAQESGIAVPCGWTWDPPVSVGVLRQLFQMAEPDLILLDPSGYLHFRPEQFVPATRSAVRASTAEVCP